MRKLFYIVAILLLHVSTVKAQEFIQEQFDYAGATIQEWIVPDGVSFLTINAVGAQGGNTQVGTRVYRGGGGAQVIGDFPITPGSKIIMVVGGIGSSNLQQAGGGGGTFVFVEDNSSPYALPDGTRITPLLVAGGGGGAYLSESNGVSPGNDEEEGSNTKVGSSTLYGGTGGSGGQGADAGGGGGFLGNGDGSGNTAGKSYLNSFAGGVSTTPSLNGGFGGGGAGYPGTGSGGGGGWSGGAAGRSQRGGGGGSFNGSPIEDSKLNSPGGNAGNFGTGRVIISYYIGVLPLKLTSFTAHQQQSGVTLRWNTAQERNTSHFEIQKSTDGRNFSTIGQAAAAGYSHAFTSYSFTDSRPLSKVNHYRLKMVDNDGKVAYSKVVVVRTEIAGIQLQVFPNPATSGIQLQTGIKGDLQIMIYDAKGRQVKRLLAKNEGISTSFSIDVSYLNKGIYYVKVLGENELQTTSFIKK